MPLIGIIANPSSGKDIRRLVADADGVDNQQKARIVRRALRGIAATAATAATDTDDPIRVAVMPEQADIRRRALDGLEPPFPVSVLDSDCRGVAEDSQAAAEELVREGAVVIIVLGGDGTHRMVAKGCRDLPLVPISTGTNNVWPKRNEGTLAGIAAALVVQGRVPIESACRQTPRLDVLRDGQPLDMALVDVAACDIRVPGARAMWDISRIHQLVLSQALPGVLGLSAIGGSLPPPPDGPRRGLALEIGPGGDLVLAPIAPGLVVPVPVRSVRWIEPGERVAISDRPGTLALDGERETPIRTNDNIVVEFNPHGPTMVDVDLTLQLAADSGSLILPRPPAD
jgi:hypothetical protein